MAEKRSRKKDTTNDVEKAARSKKEKVAAPKVASTTRSTSKGDTNKDRNESTKPKTKNSSKERRSDDSKSEVKKVKKNSSLQPDVAKKKSSRSKSPRVAEDGAQKTPKASKELKENRVPRSSVPAVTQESVANDPEASQKRRAKSKEVKSTKKRTDRPKDEVDPEDGLHKESKLERVPAEQAVIKVDKVDETLTAMDDRKLREDEDEPNLPDPILQAEPETIADENTEPAMGSIEHADPYGDYEDDFEDYDEDFEDFEEDEDDGDGLGDDEARDTVSSPPLIDSRARRGRAASVQSRIDFLNASSSEAQLGAAFSARRRHQQLARLVELDAVSFEALRLAPIRDYDLYVQSFGKGNRVQAQTQTGGDDVDRDVQVEAIEMDEKWTQHPPNDRNGCGGGDQVQDDAAHDEPDALIVNSATYPARFCSFVQDATQLITDLLYEGVSADSLTFREGKKHKFSVGYNSFSLHELATGSSVAAVECCPNEPTVFATAFFVTDSVADELVNKSVICVWSLSDADDPRFVLLAEGEVRGCCFGAHRAEALFAAMADGSVSAFDLRESGARHRPLPWKSGDVALRSATYDTAFVHGGGGGGRTSEQVAAPLRCITTLDSSSATNSYQLASFDERCEITIWTVLQSSGQSSASELDFGLSPNGNLKLVKSATLSLAQRSPTVGSVSVHGFAIAYHMNTFWIGTDAGYIGNVQRHSGGDAYPKTYRSGLDAPCDILCLAVSPFDKEILLAGASDGFVRLYRTSEAAPLAALRPASVASAPVTYVDWSPVAPLVLYSVHGCQHVATWDLQADRRQPVQLDSLDLQINCISLTKSSADVIGFDNGNAEVHKLESSRRSTARPTENSLSDVLALM